MEKPAFSLASSPTGKRSRDPLSYSVKNTSSTIAVDIVRSLCDWTAATGNGEGNLEMGSNMFRDILTLEGGREHECGKDIILQSSSGLSNPLSRWGLDSCWRKIDDDTSQVAPMTWAGW